MLGAHTKLINSYGKRKNRIVTVNHDDQSRPARPINIFEDMEVVEIQPLVSRMKKRENSTPKKPQLGSPRRVHVSKGMAKKKHLSSGLGQKNRVARIFEEFSGKKKDREDEEVEEVERILQDTPPRAPLASHSLNVPASPMLTSKPAQKKRPKSLAREPTAPFTDPEITHLEKLTSALSLAPSTPKKHAEPKSKLADRMKRRQTSSSKDVQIVDIIVIDTDGTPVKQERRVSRKDINVNVDVPEIISVDDSPQPKSARSSKLTKKGRAARHLVVISDSEDSDVEEVSAPHPPDDEVEELPAIHVKKTPPKTNGLARSGSSGPKGLMLEVMVPPAPYPTGSSSRSLKDKRDLSSSASSSSVATPEPSLPKQQSQPRPSAPAAPLITNPKFAHLFSPPAKPRQLTPIRRGGRNSLFPHRGSPRAPFGHPSSSGLEDLSIDDLSLDLEELNLGIDTSGEIENSFGGVEEFPEYLRPLLKECHQSTCGPVEFSAFIETFPFDPVVGGRGADGLRFKKIGEASYSEVFGIGDVVLKVIPLRDESAHNQTAAEDIVDGPAESDAKDVLREIIVTREMGEVCEGGFVELLKTYVVRGKYPEVLLRLWDEYDEIRGSESVRPDTFLVSQIYAIVVLPNGGPDLETYKFANPSAGWRQASSLFWQVAKTLARAEMLVSFEHRDLHWGQILVQSSSPSGLTIRDTNLPRGTRVPMDDELHGVYATLIDLGLARMDARDGHGGEIVHWTSFDEEIFMGEGDYQFDVYRMMRHHVAEDWEGFKPLTNVMWLHYLLQKLLYWKGLKPPKASPSSSQSTFSERECYESLLEVERWLAAHLARECPSDMKKSGVKKPRGKPRKTVAAVIHLVDDTAAAASCAGEVVAFAVRKGWVMGI